MTEVIGGVEVPATPAVAEATRVVRETTSPLIFHHSRRVFFFGAMHAEAQGRDADPELLYLAAIFHDTGLTRTFSDVVQRFELDGADHARKFLEEHGLPGPPADTVWTAIALHTTPGIPARMGPEIAATASGVLTDVVGHGLDQLDDDRVDEVLAAHPRGNFKQDFLEAYADGQKHRPDTTYGTVNADVIRHVLPDYEQTGMVRRVLEAPWPT